MGIFGTMIVQQFDITELIPQRYPMIMVDRVAAIEETSTTTVFKISEDNIFSKKGVFTEPGMIENIAQTAAAGMGYLNKIQSEKVSIGYIAAIRDLTIHFLPPVNTEIRTDLVVINKVLGFTIIRGTVFSDNRIAAECEMRIFVQQS